MYIYHNSIALFRQLIHTCKIWVPDQLNSNFEIGFKTWSNQSETYQNMINTTYLIDLSQNFKLIQSLGRQP